MIVIVIASQVLQEDWIILAIDDCQIVDLIGSVIRLKHYCLYNSAIMFSYLDNLILNFHLLYVLQDLVNALPVVLVLVI